MGDTWRGWLARLGDGPARDGRDPAETAALELQSACPVLGAETPALRVEPAMGEGYAVTREAGGAVITGGAVGVLYGTYAWLLALATGGGVPEGVQRPFYPLRMLDAWNNVDGTVERGYSGRSLWFEGGAFSWEPARIRLLGRLMASVGVNVLCVNNVNVKDGAERLIEDQLPGLARLADALRPYGVRLMVSVSFAQPLMRGLPTADPLDEGVAAWWCARADAVWAAVPDLAGFLVKADSEHRPGPFTYGRSHAEGANMLARAVAPHGGVLVWRAFVYNCAQDWRDHATDRPKAACDTYLPHFLSLVIVVSMAQNIFSSDGAVNQLLLALGIIREPVFWLGEGKYFWWLVGFINVWKEMGWNSIIYISTMTSIDPSLYEAASIDGAGRFQKILHVTLPGIKSTFVVLLIMNIGHLLEAGFEIQYLMGQNLVIDWSQTIDVFVMKYGISKMQYSVGVAAGMFKSVVSILLLFLANFIAKKLDEDTLI